MLISKLKSAATEYTPEEQYWVNEFIQKENFRIFFQPIITIDKNQVHAYEALSRGPIDSPYENKTPFILIDKVGKTGDLDLIAIKKTLDIIKTYGRTEDRFFVNILIENLKYIEQAALSEQLKKQIIFEIDFNNQLYDIANTFEYIEKYRTQGIQFAIDDIGKKTLDYEIIKSISPAYIKIDISLTRDIHESKEKQDKMLEFVNLSKEIDSKLIVEGVEKQEELECIKKLGSDYVQGFYFSKPVPSFREFSLDDVKYRQTGSF